MDGDVRDGTGDQGLWQRLQADFVPNLPSPCPYLTNMQKLLKRPLMEDDDILIIKISETYYLLFMKSIDKWIFESLPIQ